MELETLKKVNSLIKYVDSYTNKSDGLVNSVKSHDGLGSYGESQGDYNEFQRTFKTPFDGILLKVTIQTDSYGYNDHVVGMEFVKAKAKEITVFETENL